MSCKFHGPLLALWSIRKNYFPSSKVLSQSYRLICSYEDSKSKQYGSLAGPNVRQVFSNLLCKQHVLKSHGVLTTVKVFYCSKKPVECDDHKKENVLGKKDVESDDSKKESVPEKKLSIFKRFKAMYRDYWYVLVPVHLVTSAVWFGSFYYMASSGVDIAALAEMIHLSEATVEKIRTNSNTLAGHLAVSYLLYKIFTPLRYTVTVGGTTISINYLKRWGYIKPIPKKDVIKKMFEEKKVSFRKKRDNFRVKRDLMKKNVIEKLTPKKRSKKTNEIIKKVLQNKRVTKNG
nr:protein FAM210A [Halyomorpha halys]